MPEPVFKYGLAVIKDKKLLVVRKRNTSKYIMPGGKPLEGETAEQTLEREIWEELSCRIKTGSLDPFDTFEDRSALKPYPIIEMKVYLGEIEGVPKPSGEIVEVRWIEKSDLDLMTPIIKDKIVPALIKRGHIE